MVIKWAKGTKVVVTGGAGFIGSHLVDALVDHHDVVVIDNLSTGKRSQVNKKARFVGADICNLKKIKPYFRGAKLVFHLAARARIQPSIQDPVPTFNSNVIGTLNVLLAARDAKVNRVIYSASSSSYGDQNSLPLIEDMRPRFKNPYALSKYVGEELCRLFSNLYSLETVSLRYFNVYGRRQLTQGAYATVIGIFLKQLNEGKPLTIVGDGAIRRDFTHVSDVVRANLLAAESHVHDGEVINIGAGSSYGINEVAQLILSKWPSRKNSVLARLRRRHHGMVPLFEARDRGLVTYIKSRPGETLRTLADNSRARQLLGWKPKVFLADGLAKLISEQA